MINISIFSLFRQFTKQTEPPESALRVGSFRLVESPSFAVSFLGYITRSIETDLPDFPKWKRFLSENHTAPKAPDRENPNLYKNPQYKGRDDLEARTYRAYIFNKKIEQYNNEKYRIAEIEEKKRSIRLEYGADQVGYIRYMLDQLPEARDFFETPQPFYFDEERRITHTYVIGGTGSGKSEVMKTLIHHYLTRNIDTALVLIDPHGKFAREVAQFQENAHNDRLMFIAPTLEKGYTPVFNPFDIPEGSTPEDIDVLSQELLSAFQEILKSAELTAQMITILKPCISTLLHKPNATILDLQLFMDENRNGELIEYGIRHLENPSDVDFLRHDFQRKTYSPTRQSIRTKIQSLVGSLAFRRFLVGKSTFSLVDAIEQKKLMIFSLYRNVGKETSDAMGRLILSQLQGIAMQREKFSEDPEALEKEVPIHAIVDECQHYITPSIETILVEARKYKLYLTLANQNFGQIKDTELKSAIRGNTHLKIIGAQTDPPTLNMIEQTTGANPEEIKALSQGKYHIKAGMKIESMIVQNGADLLDTNHSMTPDQWETVKQGQIKRYYRSLTCDSEGIAPENDKAGHQSARKKRSLN